MLYWAKVNDMGQIPTKRGEDAGYDIYPAFRETSIRVPSHETRLIPTGIACAFPEGYVMILKERGSTGTKGIAQRAGVIDSGYRGEILVPVTNTGTKDLYITKEVMHLEDYVIEYPYDKAICQAILVPLADLSSKEIDYEDLKKMGSLRGDGKLGSTNK